MGGVEDWGIPLEEPALKKVHVGVYCGADKYLSTRHNPGDGRRALGVLIVDVGRERTQVDPFGVLRPTRASRGKSALDSPIAGRDLVGGVVFVCPTCGQRYYFNHWLPALNPVLEAIARESEEEQTSRAAYDLFRTWLRLEHPQIFKQLPAVEALAAGRSVPTLVMQRLGLLDTP